MNFSPSLVWLLAVTSGLSVANVYYAQPLLDAFARDFGFAQDAVGGVITATQAGSVMALLLLVPLGDVLDRRRLLVAQMLLLSAALVAVVWVRGPLALLVSMLVVGLLGTAMTQGLIASAAAFAPPTERGRIVGTVQGGVLVGLLLARVIAGSLADVGGWRVVYGASAAVSLPLAAILWCLLPRQSAPVAKLSYLFLLGSMGRLVATSRVLQVRGMLALLMFAAFGIFWSAVVLPLRAAPHGWSHTAIGALGLVGVAGALAAGRAGRWADQGLGQRTTGVALVVLLLSWLPLALMPHSLWALLIGIVMLDLAGQAIHITNQSLIFSAETGSPSRLVGCYMVFYAVGSGLGALAATQVYAAAGWTGVCLLGAGVSVVALVFWVVTLAPEAKNTDEIGFWRSWFGRKQL